MPLAIKDPVFSDKALDIANYPKNSLTHLVNSLYSTPPIYFETTGVEDNHMLNEQLQRFTDSEQFTLFTHQLDICLEKINTFIAAYPQQIRSSQIEQQILTEFVQRLKTDFFVEKRKFLYREGKKYLEMLAILFQDPNIDPAYKIVQLSSLQADGGLRLCADGCFSRLQLAVENLQAHLDDNPYRYMEQFLNYQIEKNINNKHPFDMLSPLQSIVAINTGVDQVQNVLGNNEIHYRNYLKEQLMRWLGYDLDPGQVRDSYVDVIETNIEQTSIKQKIKSIVLRGKTYDLSVELTATNLIKFIAENIYSLHREPLSTMQSITEFEKKLNALGHDPSFGLHSVVDEETFKIKSMHTLYPTLSKRLENQGFFIKNEKLERIENGINGLTNNHYQFLYFGPNFSLHSIAKKQGDNANDFINLVNFLTDSSAWPALIDSVDLESRDTFFRALIQTLPDFILFINLISKADLENINLLTKLYLDLFYRSRFVWNTRDTAAGKEFIAFEKNVFTLLKLDGDLADPTSSRHFFYNNIIDPTSFNQGLKNYLTLFYGPNQIVVAHSHIQTITPILKQIAILKIKNFNQLIFPERQILYFRDLAFPGTQWEDTRFEVEIHNCFFDWAEFTTVIFKDVIATNFEHAKIFDTRFTKNVDNINFKHAVIEKSYFETLVNGDFTHAKITDTNFKEINAKILLPYSLSAYSGEQTSFAHAIIDKTIFGLANNLNFFKAVLTQTRVDMLGGFCTFKLSKLRDVSFNYQDLDASLSFLNCELEQVNFREFGHSTTGRSALVAITDSKLENLEFKGLAMGYFEIKDSSLINVIFNEVTFDDEFSFSNCIFKKVVFKTANLDRVAFPRFKDGNQPDLDITLENVSLNVFQLVYFYQHGLKDFSTVKLVNNESDMSEYYLSVPEWMELKWYIPKDVNKLEHYLSRVDLSGAHLSPQATLYLKNNQFKFQNIDLRHIDFSSQEWVGIKLEGATISLEQAMQFYLNQHLISCNTNIVLNENFYQYSTDYGVKLLQSEEGLVQIFKFLIEFKVQDDSSNAGKQHLLIENLNRNLMAGAQQWFSKLDSGLQQSWLEKIAAQAQAFEVSKPDLAAKLVGLHAQLAHSIANIQALVRTQKLFRHLEQVLKQKPTLHQALHGPINQWQMLNLETLIPQRGRCLGFTKAFAESLRQNKVDHYLKSLDQLAAVAYRNQHDYWLSDTEKNQIDAFFTSLNRLENEGLNQAHWERAMAIDAVQLTKNRLPQSLIMTLAGAETRGNYALFLTLGSGRKQPRHQVGIFFTNQQYHYFDSNAGYVSGIRGTQNFMNFLRLMLPKSYGHHSRQLAFELYYSKTQALDSSSDIYQPLFNFRSEKDRLASQDKKALLALNELTQKRVQFYEWGINLLDSEGKVIAIDGQLSLPRQSEALQAKRITVNKIRYQQRFGQLLTRLKSNRVVPSSATSDLELAAKLLPYVENLPSAASKEIGITLQRYLDNNLKTPPDIRAEKNLKKLWDKNPSLDFAKRLEQTQLKKNILKQTKNQLAKGDRISGAGFISLVLSRSLFDIGKSIIKGDEYHTAVGIAYLSYAMLISPRLETLVTLKTDKLLTKLASIQTIFKQTLRVNLPKSIEKVANVRLLAKILGSIAGNLLDVKDLTLGVMQILDSETGSRDQQDGLFETSLASFSLGSGAVLVVLNGSGPVGAGLAVGIVVSSGTYYGIRLFKDFEIYGLTDREALTLFAHGFFNLQIPQDMQYLEARKEMVNLLAREGAATLAKLDANFVSYGAGLGEYVMNKDWYARQFSSATANSNLNEPIKHMMPGKSQLLMEPTTPDHSEHLSRIIPANPSASNETKRYDFACLPSFRNEPIELESDWMGNVVGLYSASRKPLEYQCENSFVIDDTTRMALVKKNKQILKMYIKTDCIRAGIIHGRREYDMFYEIHASDTNLMILGSPFHKNEYFITDENFRGQIEGGHEGKNILYLPFNHHPANESYTYQAFINVVHTLQNKTQVDYYGTNQHQPRFSASNIQFIVGQNRNAEIIACSRNAQAKNYPLWIQSKGGVSKTIPMAAPENLNMVELILKGILRENAFVLQPFINNCDFIIFCEQVILEGFTHYLANNKRWGQLALKIITQEIGEISINPSLDSIAQTPTMSKKAALNQLSLQSLHFLDSQLVDDMDFYYFAENNRLVLEKPFFKLTLTSYFNFVEQRPNYQLVTSANSEIRPLLDDYWQQQWPSNQTKIQLKRFVLIHFEDNDALLNLTNAYTFSENDQKGDKNIELISLVNGKTLQGEKFSWCFGSSGADHLQIDANYTHGDHGSDHYFLSPSAELKKINNFVTFEKNQTLDIDQIVVFAESNPLSPATWAIYPSRSLEPTHLLISSEQVNLMLENYLKSAAYQHLIVRYVDPINVDRYFIPLQLTSQQFKWAPYYPERHYQVNNLFADIVNTAVVVQGSPDVSWLRTQNDLILETPSHQKWVLNHYFNDVEVWAKFKICFTRHANLISVIEQPEVCIGRQNFASAALLAIDMNKMINTLYARFIQAYHLNLTSQQQIITVDTQNNASESALIYFDIPFDLKVTKISAQPLVETNDLQLQINATTQNYSVIIKNTLFPDKLKYLRYQTLLLDLTLEETLPGMCQPDINLGLLGLEIENYLNQLSNLQRSGLTLVQLAFLIKLEPLFRQDSLNYFYLVEKGFGLNRNEHDRLLDWLANASENIWQQIHTALQNPPCITSLLFVAMLAATQENFSRVQFEQCFNWLGQELCQSLWKNVREPLLETENIEQRFTHLTTWAETHIDLALTALASQLKSTAAANQSQYAADPLFEKINHLQLANLVHDYTEGKIAQVGLEQNPPSESTTKWLYWGSGALITSLTAVLGAGVWLARRRFRSGYTGAKATSLAGGMTLLEFKPAEAQLEKNLDINTYALSATIGQTWTFTTQAAPLFTQQAIDVEALSLQLAPHAWQLAAIIANHLKQKRCQRVIKADFAQRVAISQCEAQHIRFELNKLVSRFITTLLDNLKKQSVTYLTQISTLIIQQLKSSYYTDMAQAINETKLKQKIEIALQTSPSQLPELLSDLFYEKIYQKIKQANFSAQPELADKQKAAYLSIIPVITQSEDQLFGDNDTSTPKKTYRFTSWPTTLANFFRLQPFYDRSIANNPSKNYSPKP